MNFVPYSELFGKLAKKINGRIPIFRETHREFLARNSRVPYPLKHLDNFYGGEKIVYGYTQRHKRAPRSLRDWQPSAPMHTYRSEVLDRDVRARYTENVRKQIDFCGGLDNYLLLTPKHRLQSHLGESLRNEIQNKLLLATNEDIIKYVEEKMQVPYQTLCIYDLNEKHTKYPEFQHLPVFESTEIPFKF